MRRRRLSLSLLLYVSAAAAPGLAAVHEIERLRSVQCAVAPLPPLSCPSVCIVRQSTCHSTGGRLPPLIPRERHKANDPYSVDSQRTLSLPFPPLFCIRGLLAVY